ncbi:head-tail connector protein [Pseudomonas fluvialis]|uniref:head-tail connector protein n=1 Tax=Pseudomonas fluvialis TaxID=1793966 RepID=UPI0035B38E48
MVTLEEAKNHLRIELTETEDDAAITTMIDAATAHILEYLHTGIIIPTPAPLKAAVLLLVADLYQNRERQTVGQALFINRTFEMLLQPYRYCGTA